MLQYFDMVQLFVYSGEGELCGARGGNFLRKVKISLSGWRLVRLFASSQIPPVRWWIHEPHSKLLYIDKTKWIALTPQLLGKPCRWE